MILKSDYFNIGLFKLMFKVIRLYKLTNIPGAMGV